jgi:hypothetical protein
MKKRKMTVEEFRAYRAAREERIEQLRRLAARIRAELDGRRREKPA